MNPFRKLDARQIISLPLSHTRWANGFFADQIAGSAVASYIKTTLVGNRPRLTASFCVIKLELKKVVFRRESIWYHGHLFGH